MRGPWLAGLAVVAALLHAPGPASAAPALPAGFEDNHVVGGLDQPTAFGYTPDGRMLVAEKPGIVRAVSAAGVVDPDPVIDITGHVNSRVDRGLLGLAVDKDYTSNHYVYLLYTYEHNSLDPTGPKVSKLTRIKVGLNNELEAGETTILGKSGVTSCPLDNTVDCIPSEYTWHSIGTVRSDPVDGTLWVGSGDGQMSLNFNSTTLQTQDERSLRGKILHVDRNGRGLAGHPFCPADSNLDHNCTKVYAKGFRNPFRFSLRPGKGPIVGDVGADDREEVDLVQPGGNYGWPCYEGTIRNGIHEASGTCQALYAAGAGAVKPPVWEYSHALGSAIAAGPVYAGTNYPSAYRGDVFVADFAGGWFKRLKIDADDRLQEVVDFAQFPADDSTTPPTPSASPVDIGVTPQGDLAYMDIGYTANPAGLHRFRWTPGNASPVASATGAPRAGPSPLKVSFDASGSTDPDGDALTYTWDFGDGQTGSGARVDHVYPQTTGAYTATVTVSDGRGGSAKATVGPITPGNYAPEAWADAPPTFRYGNTVTVDGGAWDRDEGVLGGTRLKWRVFQQHGSHTHSYGDFTGSRITFNAGTDHDADSHFVARLTATDARGATDVKTIELRPETRDFTLASRPPGIPLTYGTAAAAAPVTRRSAIGFAATIGAPATARVDGIDYDFLRWSDGGARQHEFTIPAWDTTATAEYNGRPSAAIEAAPGGTARSLDLSAAGSRDPEGAALTYAWDFGDGATGSGQRVTHGYATTAPRRVTLTVTDPHGATGTTTRSVTPGAARPPLLRLALPRSGTRLRRAGKVALTIANPGAATITGKVTLTTKKAVRSGRGRAKKVRLAGASFTVAAHGKRKLALKLSKANRKLVARLRSVPVVVSWSARERGTTMRAGGRSNWKLLAPRRRR